MVQTWRLKLNLHQASPLVSHFPLRAYAIAFELLVRCRLEQRNAPDPCRSFAPMWILQIVKVWGQFFERTLQGLYNPNPIDCLIGQHDQCASRKKGHLPSGANAAFFPGADCTQFEVAYSASSSSLAAKEP